MFGWSTREQGMNCLEKKGVRNIRAGRSQVLLMTGLQCLTIFLGIRAEIQQVIGSSG